MSRSRHRTPTRRISWRLLVSRRAVEVALPVVAVGMVLAVVPAAHAEGPGYGGGADSLTVSWTKADSSSQREGTTDQPAPEQPAPDQPTQEQPTKQQPAPDQPTQEQPAPQQPTKEQPAPEEPAQEQPAPEQPAPEQPAQQGDGGSPAAAGPVSGVRGAAVAAVAPPTVVTDTGLGLQVGGVGFRGRSVVEVRVGSDAPFTTRTGDSGTLDVLVPSSTAETAETGTSVVAIGRSPSGTSMTMVGAVPPRPSGVGPVDLVPWVAAALALGLAGSWLVARLRPAREGQR